MRIKFICAAIALLVGTSGHAHQSECDHPHHINAKGSISHPSKNSCTAGPGGPIKPGDGVQPPRPGGGPGGTPGLSGGGAPRGIAVQPPRPGGAPGSNPDAKNGGDPPQDLQAGDPGGIGGNPTPGFNGGGVPGLPTDPGRSKQTDLLRQFMRDRGYAGNPTEPGLTQGTPVNPSIGGTTEIHDNTALDKAQPAQEISQKMTTNNKAAEEEAANEAGAEPMLLFDADWYRSKYSDLAHMTNEEAEAHFLKYGWKEGRLWSPQDALSVFDYVTAQHAEETSNSFDADWYRSKYPDLAHMTNEEAEAHFLSDGWKEGRASHAQDNQYEQFFAKIDAQLVLHMSPFDADWYRSKYPDLAHMTNEEAEAHFLSDGWKEGRSMYEGHNPDEDVLPEALYIERHGLFKYMQGFSKNSLSVLVKFHKGVQNGLSKQGKTLTDIVQKVEEEAAKKKAADEKAANDKSSKVINPADVVGDNTATDKFFQSLVHYGRMRSQDESIRKEAAAIMKAAEKEAPAKNTKVVDSYILTSKSLMKMYEKGNIEPYKLQGNINAVEIKQFKGTQIKTITLDGQSKTISCGDTCTLYSAKKNSLQVGSDLGIPAYIHKAIMDAIVEAMGEEFVKNLSETELRKFQVAMRKLIVPHWKSLEDVVAKVMGDPNFNIASFMTKEQIEQIKTIQRQIRKSSQKNKGSGQESSGGSAADGETSGHHEEDHHHEEEDPGPAPAMSSGSMAYP